MPKGEGHLSLIKREENRVPTTTTGKASPRQDSSVLKYTFSTHQLALLLREDGKLTLGSSEAPSSMEEVPPPHRGRSGPALR